MPIALLQWNIWPRKYEVVCEQTRWIQYLRLNKLEKLLALGEGLCAQPQCGSLSYSLWTSTAWVMVTKASATLHHWNAFSWIRRTTVRGLEKSGPVLPAWKSWLLPSHTFGGSSPLESKGETILTELMLWSPRDPFGYKQQKPPPHIHCHWREVHSGHQEHWTPSRAVACFHSQLHSASMFNYKTCNIVMLHKVCSRLDFSPTQYLWGNNYVATALLQQLESIKKLQPKRKLTPKDKVPDSQSMAFSLKISS